MTDDFEADFGDADGMIEAGDFTGGGRPLFELAAALRRRDIVEAELQLDRIALIIGTEAMEEVEQGRYGYRAQVTP